MTYYVGALVRSGHGSDIYRLVRRLGDGASASVFEAVDLRRGHSVALKLLRRGAPPAPLRRECAALQALVHPNIVRLLSFGFTPEGVAYLVMPLLKGTQLRVVLDQQGPLGLERSLDCATELFAGLAVAHAAGILHGDLRPDNLLLERLAPRVHRLVLLDFGLSCSTEAATAATRQPIGDPRYAAPELFFGRHRSFATDLYAAGLVLFEMITGKHPLEAEGDDWTFTHSFVRPAPLGAVAPGTPAALEVLQASLLAKDPRERPASADECAQAIGAIQQRLLSGEIYPTTEDVVDSLLRRVAGPDPEEDTQVQPPPPSLLREASGSDDTDQSGPPSSCRGPNR